MRLRRPFARFAEHPLATGSVARGSLAAWALAAGSLALASVSGQAPPAPFRNLNGTFHIELPAGWRQIAPNEARAVGARPDAPRRLGLAQPRHFYAVGPVETWQRGDFTGPWLYVFEQSDEWYVDDEFAKHLAESWAAQSRETGERHQLADVRREKVGTQQIDAVTAVRTSTPPDGRPATKSLDVHAPAGGRQLTLSFTCPPDAFATWEPQFRGWLATLTFARKPREPATLGDRLWTPLLTGAAVGLILLLLYKHTRGRR